MENFTFYSPTKFVFGKEEDIPTLVKNLCYGDGRDGTISGFVTLNEDDCTKIYQAMIRSFTYKATNIGAVSDNEAALKFVELLLYLIRKVSIYTLYVL